MLSRGPCPVVVVCGQSPTIYRQYSAGRGVGRSCVMLYLALVLCARASVGYGDYERPNRDIRNVRTADKTASGCYYEGSWFVAGKAVRTREACLSCVCGEGGLSCRRRSCAPTPDPPTQCSVIHRRGECCPELHCPNSIIHLDDAASSRSDDSYIDMPSSIGRACVEGGTVYAAGSAMTSTVACEQCFCLGGRRRCVRPRCLPPPPGCTPRPASGACCPQRYYCLHEDNKPPTDSNSHDCITPTGIRIPEGGRVKESETSDCVQCFCLHGFIRCQHLSCAPTIHGCKPLVQPGQCCAHQYVCDHSKNGTNYKNLSHVRQNILLPLKEETRSLHSSKSTKRETTLGAVASVSEKSTAAVTVTKEEPIKSTTKVKRKTDEFLDQDTVASDRVDTTKVMESETTLNNNDIASTITTETTTEMTVDSEESVTEQPEGSVRIIINGTINCTAELSSTSLFLNVTNTNDTIWFQNDVQPRIPLIDKIENLDHTFPPNDIITEGNHNANFDENETFTVNVTSSLHTNSTRIIPSTMSSTGLPKTVLPALFGAVNISKTKKEEYDYDYTEPTLPPSLPNLKIIPFVAADAVLENNMSSKEMPNYPSLTKDDKFPVYYPSKDSKEAVYATHREDIYNLTHYSMFAPEKTEPQYPGIIQDEDPVDIAYPRLTEEVGPDVHEYTVSASFGNPSKLSSSVGGEPILASKFDIKSPDVNLFSPPVETEGGFVPKDPVLIDDYYSVYHSTSSGIIPHLTTSMPLNTKDECLSKDGRRVSDGESINIECSICSCVWGELHCSPRPCHTPPGCKRLTSSKNTDDLCCEKIICDQTDKVTEVFNIPPSGFQESLNKTKVASIYEDKNNKSVTQNANPSYDNDIRNDNKSTNSMTIKHKFEDTLIDNTTESSVTNGIILNTSTTEKVNLGSPPSNHTLDYEEDEDDDEGFSLGSVLKLLLSETYETTTSASKKKPTTTTHLPKVVTTTTAATTTRKQSNIPPFVPLTHHFPYTPPKQSLHRFDTVDRIDHLVLGEASAIRTTSTQTPVTYKPISYTTTKNIFTTKSTKRPVPAKSVEINSKEGYISQSVNKRPTSNIFSGFGLGLPKLAGCNIYGRMYRVGRIIAELSSPCQECKCTEVGVECRSLGC